MLTFMLVFLVFIAALFGCVGLTNDVCGASVSPAAAATVKLDSAVLFVFPVVSFANPLHATIPPAAVLMLKLELNL